jgi:hypothetical protein
MTSGTGRTAKKKKQSSSGRVAKRTAAAHGPQAKKTKKLTPEDTSALLNAGKLVVFPPREQETSQKEATQEDPLGQLLEAQTMDWAEEEETIEHIEKTERHSREMKSARPNKESMAKDEHTSPGAEDASGKEIILEAALQSARHQAVEAVDARMKNFNRLIMAIEQTRKEIITQDEEAELASQLVMDFATGIREALAEGTVKKMQIELGPAPFHKARTQITGRQAISLPTEPRTSKLSYAQMAQSAIVESPATDSTSTEARMEQKPTNNSSPHSEQDLRQTHWKRATGHLKNMLKGKTTLPSRRQDNRMIVELEPNSPYKQASPAAIRDEIQTLLAKPGQAITVTHTAHGLALRAGITPQDQEELFKHTKKIEQALGARKAGPVDPWIKVSIENVPRTMKRVVDKSLAITINPITDAELTQEVELAFNAKPQYVRWTRATLEQETEYGTVTAAFRQTDLPLAPRRVSLFCYNLPVKYRARVPKIMQCRRCWRFHRDTGCTRTPRCEFCGSSQHPTDKHNAQTLRARSCKATAETCQCPTATCANCEGPHPATSLECPLRPQAHAKTQTISRVSKEQWKKMKIKMRNLWRTQAQACPGHDPTLLAPPAWERHSTHSADDTNTQRPEEQAHQTRLPHNTSGQETPQEGLSL